MTVVVDASVVVAAFVDSGTVGEWAESMLVEDPLAAPHVMPAEVANILRRSQLVGEISADVASLAHDDLAGLRLALFPYEPFASRVWALRANVTAYDGWYVALAESLETRLATLDSRLAAAPGTMCAFATPPR